ncbi:hypothetical protein GCM10007908_33900 [Rhizobium albus]|nr:hypothetical protein GCM10007908_33900 [Rhizobium albus]
MKNWVSVAAFLTSCLPAFAADIYTVPADGNRPTVIVVEGELVENDHKRFQMEAILLDEALVMLASEGGLVIEGIEIGRTIEFKGFSTVVAPNTVCASACGLAWLAGKQRAAFDTSLIGFHAAFDGNTGAVSGIANALVGSYLSKLGMSDTVIALSTLADPSSMTWLTPELASIAKIDVEWFEDTEKTPAASAYAEPAPSNPPSSTIAPATPPAQRWAALGEQDLPGSDLPGMPMRLDSTSQCQAACETHTQCVAYTFNEGAKACFLKNGASRSTPFTGAQSAYRADLVASPMAVGLSTSVSGPFRMSEGSEIRAPGREIFRGVTLQWCHEACVSSPNCPAYSYYPANICEFKSASEPAERNPAVISGMKLPF